MSPQPTVPFSARVCPFCGLAADGPHEKQEGCILALQAEIGRVRGILANLKAAGIQQAPTASGEKSGPVRVTVPDANVTEP